MVNVLGFTTPNPGLALVGVLWLVDEYRRLACVVRSRSGIGGTASLLLASRRSLCREWCLRVTQKANSAYE